MHGPSRAEKGTGVVVGFQQRAVAIEPHPVPACDRSDVTPLIDLHGGGSTQFGQLRRALDDQIQVTVVKTAGDVELPFPGSEVEKARGIGELIPPDPAFDRDLVRAGQKFRWQFQCGVRPVELQRMIGGTRAGGKTWYLRLHEHRLSFQPAMMSAGAGVRRDDRFDGPCAHERLATRRQSFRIAPAKSAAGSHPQPSALVFGQPDDSRIRQAVLCGERRQLFRRVIEFKAAQAGSGAEPHHPWRLFGDGADRRRRQHGAIGQSGKLLTVETRDAFRRTEPERAVRGFKEAAARPARESVKVRVVPPAAWLERADAEVEACLRFVRLHGQDAVVRERDEAARHMRPQPIAA